MVGLGQDQGCVQIEKGLDVSSVESRTTLQGNPTRQENREIEQIQQMFNLDDEQTILQTSLMDTDDEKNDNNTNGD